MDYLSQTQWVGVIMYSLVLLGIVITIIVLCKKDIKKIRHGNI